MSKWNVTVTKSGTTYICQATDDPFRFKCGRCLRGVVVTTKGNLLKTTGKCQVCKAYVRVEYWNI